MTFVIWSQTVQDTGLDNEVLGRMVIISYLSVREYLTKIKLYLKKHTFV